MSQLSMELDELAVEKGFQDYQEAHAHGYTFTTDDKGQTILALTYAGELEAAHRAQLVERDKMVEELIILRDDAADLAMGTGTHTDEWSKVALLADKVANYIKEEVK